MARRCSYLHRRDASTGVANVRANSEVGVGPPTEPQLGMARLVPEPTDENRRRLLVVWHRLGRPMELKDSRLVIIEVDPQSPPFAMVILVQPPRRGKIPHPTSNQIKSELFVKHSEAPGPHGRT